MTLHERVYEDLKKRRQKVLDGDINCIPFPFERFRKEFPGIEQAKYLLLTASTKVGKTQITDFLALYHPLIYAYSNPDKIRYKLIYFTLEMSAEQKYRQFICYLLYVLSKGKIRIDPKTLRSTNGAIPLPEEILNLLNSNEYKPFFDFFNANVIFIDSIRNPTGIYAFCRDYALNNGTQYTKNIIFRNSSNNTEDIKTVDDYYTQNDEKEYRFVVVDHYGLFTLESDRSAGKLDLRGTIGKWSNEYAIKLRNKYNFIVCGVQQQSPA